MQTKQNGTSLCQASRVSLCPKLLGECKLEFLVLCQAIGELYFAGSGFVSS